MNKITLITSKGCYGCEVMKTSINNAIKETKIDVTVEVIDIEEASRKFIRTFGITDTPTIIFFKDDKYLFKKVGSVPAVVVVQWINVHFK